MSTVGSVVFFGKINKKFCLFLLYLKRIKLHLLFFSTYHCNVKLDSIAFSIKYNLFHSFSKTYFFYFFIRLLWKSISREIKEFKIESVCLIQRKGERVCACVCVLFVWEKESLCVCVCVCLKVIFLQLEVESRSRQEMLCKVKKVP